ncbi:MAG: hypothetical protein PHU08_06050 [Dehalococcoidales bacterium]|nr:hypothetical protein [Dehalococcoidales bacterium]
MDRNTQIQALKQALAEIPHLRTLGYRNGEFKSWQEKIRRLLESAYGKESVEYQRFANAPGTTFIVRTETGLEQDYNWRLDSYESALKSLVDK